MEKDQLDLSEAVFKLPSLINRVGRWFGFVLKRIGYFLGRLLAPLIDKYKMHLTSRYAYAIYIFLIWITFIDQYTIIQRISLYFKINAVEKRIEEKALEVEANRRKIYELRTNATTLEKFARENYLMHRPGEEVFVVEK